MEVEHFVGIGIGLLVSVLLMWIVWSYFCNEKGDPQGDEESQSDHAESCGSLTSSTRPITRSRRDHSISSCNEGTTDEESEGGKATYNKKKKKKGKMSSYNFQKNKYGLNDPFGEWTPNPERLKEPSSPISPKYPKSPKLKHNPIRIQHE